MTTSKNTPLSQRIAAKYGEPGDLMYSGAACGSLDALALIEQRDPDAMEVADLTIDDDMVDSAAEAFCDWGGENWRELSIGEQEQYRAGAAVMLRAALGVTA